MGARVTDRVQVADLYRVGSPLPLGTQRPAPTRSPSMDRPLLSPGTMTDTIDTLRREVDTLAGGLHVLRDAIAYRGDADLAAQAMLLARQVERVAERLERFPFGLEARQ
jgi:hypothetical protein